MATVLKLEDYLNKDSAVKSAKAALDKANKTLSSSRYADESTRSRLKQDADNALTAYNDAVSKATQSFKDNYTNLVKDSIQKQITAAEASKKQAPSKEQADQIQQGIDKLKQELQNPQAYKEPTAAPAATPTPSPTVGATQIPGGTGAATKDINADVSNVLNIIGSDPKQLVEIQKDLKNNFPQFYNGGTGGINDWQKTIDALKVISQKWLEAPSFARTTDFRTFLLKPSFSISGGGTGTGAGASYTTISDPTSAQAKITSVFKSVLFRDPTQEELTKYTQLLNEAERKNPTKVVNGLTTGGINRDQFLINLIKESPEFKSAESQRVLSATQDLQKAATNNGITLTPELLKSYAERVKGGEDINTIKASFRDMAKLGMPDSIKKLLDQGLDLSTIYSPYKSAMASVLELDPNAITLDDRTLRSAINQDGEIPLWQFQTALRKDPRWQYTNNAKESVSNSVLKVLQDFGFRG